MENDAAALATIEHGMFKHGVTSYLPTTVTAPLPETLRVAGTSGQSDSV